MDSRLYYYLVILTARKYKTAHPYRRKKLAIKSYYLDAKGEIEAEWDTKIEPMGRKKYSEFVREVALAVRKGAF